MTIKSKTKPDCYQCRWRDNTPGDEHSCCNHPNPKEGRSYLEKLKTLRAGLIAIFSSEHRIPSMLLQARIDKLGIKANPHGIKMGWFNFPWNFDPLWLEACNGFESKLQDKPKEAVLIVKGTEQDSISYTAGEQQGIATAFKAYESTCEALIQQGKQEAFKAGAQEVVSFVTDKFFPLLDMASMPVHFKDAWNAKLKEWGLDEPSPRWKEKQTQPSCVHIGCIKLPVWHLQQKNIYFCAVHGESVLHLRYLYGEDPIYLGTKERE